MKKLPAYFLLVIVVVLLGCGGTFVSASPTPTPTSLSFVNVTATLMPTATPQPIPLPTDTPANLPVAPTVTPELSNQAVAPMMDTKCISSQADHTITFGDAVALGDELGDASPTEFSEPLQPIDFWIQEFRDCPGPIDDYLTEISGAPQMAMAFLVDKDLVRENMEPAGNIYFLLVSNGLEEQLTGGEALGSDVSLEWKESTISPSCCPRKQRFEGSLESLIVVRNGTDLSSYPGTKLWLDALLVQQEVEVGVSKYVLYIFTPEELPQLVCPGNPVGNPGMVCTVEVNQYSISGASLSLDEAIGILTDPTNIAAEYKQAQGSSFFICNQECRHILPPDVSVGAVEGLDKRALRCSRLGTCPP